MRRGGLLLCSALAVRAYYYDDDESDDWGCDADDRVTYNDDCNECTCECGVTRVAEDMDDADSPEAKRYHGSAADDVTDALERARSRGARGRTRRPRGPRRRLR